MNKIAKKAGTTQTEMPDKSAGTPTKDILYHHAFDKTAQANIITTVSNGKIITANSAACKLLGYSRKELVTKSRADIFENKEDSFKNMLKQRKVKGKSMAVVTAIKKSGKLLTCEITSAIFIDEDHVELAISTIVDMSHGILKQKEIDIQKEKIVAENIILAKSKQKIIDFKTEKKVADNIILARAKSDDEKQKQAIIFEAEFRESFKLIFNSTSDVLFDSDLINNKVIISDAYENELGYKIIGDLSTTEDWVNHIHPEDLEAVMKDYRRMLASRDTQWKISYRFLRADNSIVNVISNRIILRNADGKPYRMLGYMHDISKRQVLEERLNREILLKERLIAEAAEDAKEAERSDIGKELHDNVNQLLGASKMYLDMAKQGGPNSEMCLARSSQYTLTAIEEIRKLTKGLTTDTIKNHGLREAIEKVTQDTMEMNPVHISCKLERFKEKSVTDKFKLNIFRIVQEQLNNILKHANPTKVAIQLLQNEKSIMLTISDNGVGFDTRLERKGIGLANIKSRAESYKGTADLISQPGKGCVLTVKFPFSDGLLKEKSVA